MLAAVLLALPFAAGAQGPSSPGSPAGPLRAKVQRALALLRAGDTAGAEALLLQVVTADPDHGTARLQLGQIALDRGDLDAARHHLEIATHSDPQRLYLAWFGLGRVGLLENDASTARSAFDHALEAAPRFAPAWVGRARAWLIDGHLEEARRDLASALELPSAPPDARLLAAELAIYRQSFAEARALLDPALHPRGDPDAPRAAAELLQLSIGGEVEETRLLELMGERIALPEGYLALALRALRTDDVGRALPLLRVAHALEEDNPLPWLLLTQSDPGLGPRPAPFPEIHAQMATARRLVAQEDLPAATAIASEILARRPWFVPAHLLVILDAERRGDLWTALAGLEELVSWLPRVPALESRLSDIAHQAGADSLAECAARRAVAGSPTDGALHVRLASALAAQGETEAAIAAYREAIALGFEPASVWLALGKLLLDQMAVDEALTAYERATDLDSQAAEAIGSFALSSLASRDAERTRALLERHSALHPESVDTLYALGALNLREGRVEAAEPQLRRVVELDPRHTQAHYNLAQLLLRSGRTSEGSEEMDRFQELEAAERDDWERHNRAHRLRLEAHASIEAGDPGAATDALETIVAEGTAELADWLDLADAALAAGRPRQALDGYERALGAFPYHQRALEGLARAAETLGIEDKAREARRRLELLAGNC